MAEQLSYSIRLDSSGFQSGIQSASSSLSAFKIGLANALVSNGFSLLQKAVTSFSSAFHSSLDLGSELTHLSAETGASVSDLLVLRQAFQDCGVPSSALSTSISFMNRALSGVSETGQQTQSVFAKLGLDMDELRSMSSADAFEAIGTAISGLGSASDRTAAAMAIFGRSGSSLNRVFANPEAIRQARDALGSMPAIMTNLAGTAESYQTALGRIQTQIQGAIMGALSGLLPVLDGVVKKISSIDFGSIGLEIGSWLRQIFGNGWKGLLDTLINSMKIIGVAVWESLKRGFAPLFEASTWAALGKLVGGALLGAAGMLSKAFTAIVAVLTAGINKAVEYLLEGLSYIPGLGDLAPTEEKSFGQHFDDAMKDLSWTYQPALDMASDLMDKGMKGVSKAWEGAFDGWGDAVMSSEAGQFFSGLNQARQDWKEGFLQEGNSKEENHVVEPPTVEPPTEEPAEEEPNSAPTAKASKAASQTYTDQWARIGAFAGNGAQAESLNIQRGSYNALKAVQVMVARIHGTMRNPKVAIL